MVDVVVQSGHYMDETSVRRLNISPSTIMVKHASRCKLHPSETTTKTTWSKLPTSVRRVYKLSKLRSEEFWLRQRILMCGKSTMIQKQNIFQTTKLFKLRSNLPKRTRRANVSDYLKTT